MIKSPLLLFRFVALPLFALPVTLLAQATVEYALKSGGSAVSAGGATTIALCKVDSALLTCLSDSYPRMTILCAVVIFLLIARWLLSRTGHGAD
jgi:hypothetical protein